MSESRRMEGPEEEGPAGGQGVETEGEEVQGDQGVEAGRDQGGAGEDLRGGVGRPPRTHQYGRKDPTPEAGPGGPDLVAGRKEIPGGDPQQIWEKFSC